MEDERYEIRLSGSGGQGIIMAAIVLAEAAGVYDLKYVCQTQSYGPEARGGTSKAEVIISNTPIDYPKAIRPDLLLTMNQEACDTYFHDLKTGGLLVVDSTLVRQIPPCRVAAIPFTKIAREEINKEMVANMVALGAVGELSPVISLKGLEQALMARVPRGTEDINRRALNAGIEAAKRFDLQDFPMTATVEEEI
ncbi:MAG: 2-oxoacid:acceptor oxidoreductase family protein [Deltaproteobacteria bacterium]|nr:2-oxoacid:acceptor oxidoreductase family protein [Deltaproteobacteria bacterium]MBW2047483.1 2-oxoacid:acceptor oxidoreductase family protein [Deltaproteobacteria bacterium]MBW2110814.1 2-oxoacid:acceptor oxidoreductase family protein [Deltaproteobacteria bacterium]MBW2352199.1 2-oxoacid:acceptor oxidoreductase family protein [Deltaproteobacteria bacterium]HDZ90516.1 2-oxoacid:ferredoxin oxidoreductase subunit gamma [Deltaproteobacteria bacterium]